MRFLMLSVAVLAVSACAGKVPDSAAGVVDTGRGVGFGDYDSYEAQREAKLNGETAATISPPTAVQSSALDSTNQAVVAGAGAATATAAAAPDLVRNSVGISGENDFDAVAAQRGIAEDANMIAQNRAQYTVIAPTDLPKRPGTNAPNVVEYALRTDNPVGSSLYTRSTFRAESKFAKSCAGYASADLAQEAFLAKGGPQKDNKGMDPDGDGFACSWNPAPFRAARGG